MLDFMTQPLEEKYPWWPALVLDYIELLRAEGHPIPDNHRAIDELRKEQENQSA